MHGPHALTIPAHAKVNLCLAVGPPQPPTDPRAGWHPICSWMAPISLADELTLAHAHATAGQPTCNLAISWADDAPRPTPIDWPIERDLAFRAHAALEAHLQRPLPTRATLIKRTPTGGGLGGGSADAAAMLLGLNRLFDLGLPMATLTEIALTLGSDVPFFLRDNPAAPPAHQLVESFGETRTTVPPVSAQLVLFFPPFGCETRAVYRALDASPPTHADRPRVIRAHQRALASGRIDPAALFNDLAGPAQTIQPALGPLIATLGRDSGLPVHLSGSGSTLFALTPDSAARDRATDAARHLDVPALPVALL